VERLDGRDRVVEAVGHVLGFEERRRAPTIAVEPVRERCSHRPFAARVPAHRITPERPVHRLEQHGQPRRHDVVGGELSPEFVVRFRRQIDVRGTVRRQRPLGFQFFEDGVPVADRQARERPGLEDRFDLTPRVPQKGRLVGHRRPEDPVDDRGAKRPFDVVVEATLPAPRVDLVELLAGVHGR